MNKAGLIALRGALAFFGVSSAALMTAMGQAGAVTMPTPAAWLAAALTGLGAAVAMVQSYLAQPPQ